MFYIEDEFKRGNIKLLSDSPDPKLIIFFSSDGRTVANGREGSLILAKLAMPITTSS